MSRCGRMSDFLRCNVKVAFHAESGSGNKDTTVTTEQQLLDWSTASEKVLKLTDKGRIPSCVVVKGKVFDVELRHCTPKDGRRNMNIASNNAVILTEEEKEEEFLGGIKRAETSMTEYTLNNDTGGKKKTDTCTANSNSNSNSNADMDSIWTYTSPPSLEGIIQHVPPRILSEDRVHKLVGLLLIATDKDRYFEFLLLRPLVDDDAEGYYERVTNVSIAWNGTEFNPVLMDTHKEGRLWTPTEEKKIPLQDLRDGVVRIR